PPSLCRRPLAGLPRSAHFLHLDLVYSSARHLDLHSFPTRRSSDLAFERGGLGEVMKVLSHANRVAEERRLERLRQMVAAWQEFRSEEHTSELQSLRHLVCRLLLEKKKRRKSRTGRTWLALHSAAME